MSIPSTQEALQASEDRIEQRFLCINPTPEHGWFETIDAVYDICKKKQYKIKCKRLDEYLKGKWKQSRRTFYYLANAGKVCRELKQSHEKILPGNATVCHEIDKCSRKLQKSLSEVWTRAL
jgi:hypothetical protein